MVDQFGRTIEYLRLSVTDLCNYRCIYCMGEQGVQKLSHHDILSVEDIIEIAKEASQCGIRKVRITGGEPLVRRGVLQICEGISALDGIHELCMTTNGTLLPQYA
ncbi:MAG TPA: GTP 3',8-cyclase MoaA, partial [Peptococcaceae bacterium]|nr:GTP 3',8-cyclase MoaA [Peptococcaceae bacterium]